MEGLEVIKNISLGASAILNVVALATLIIKPMRQKVIDFIRKSSNSSEQNDCLKKQNELIQKQDNDVKEIKIIVNKLNDVVLELSERVFRNEKDRLRGELFNCGGRCRRGIPLTNEEFRYIQGVYEKYNVELHSNSIGTDEYNFIRDYFNSEENQKAIS